jgi:N-acetyldiaminopimelate deacetylase
VVLTFGTISGGTVVNGIAASAKVMGTLRFIDERQHAVSFRRIRQIAAGTAMATETSVDARLEDSPWVPVVNNPAITARFTDYMRSHSGVAFADAPLTMTSEDYGYLISRIPGMMFWLGTGGEHPLHSDRYAPDGAVIEPAVNVIAEYLMQL